MSGSVKDVPSEGAVLEKHKQLTDPLCPLGTHLSVGDPCAISSTPDPPLSSPFPVYLVHSRTPEKESFQSGLQTSLPPLIMGILDPSL